MPEGVLVDTSAWVAYFRGQEPARSAVLALLQERRAFRCGPVELELRQGLRRSEADGVLNLWRGLPPLQVEEIDFASAGDLLLELRSRGITIPALDALIASLAVRREVPVLTLDQHFAAVPGLRVLAPEA
jgi:predicted nucleic acid-binding protein